MRIVKNFLVLPKLSSSVFVIFTLSGCSTTLPTPATISTPTANPEPSPSYSVYIEPDPVTTPVAEKAPIRWVNVVGAKYFSVEGLPWFATTGIFRRLPADPKGIEFSKDVNQLANNTAGAQIRFKTTSPYIYAKVQMITGSFMYHMPPTGQSGIDVFDEVTGTPRFCGVARVRADTNEYESDLCWWPNDGRMREVTLYLPLYNGIEKIEIGVAQGSLIEKPRARKRAGRIVVYGSSITQGAVASRPGLAWTNQLSRKIDQEVVNLGFSGAGLGEPELAKRISEISNVNMVVLDYEANAGEKIKDTLKPFIKLIRHKYPSVPIVVVSQIQWVWEIRSSGYTKFRDELRTYQSNVVKELKSAGDKNIYFIDGYSFIQNEKFEDALVDGVHPTDVGHTQIADGMYKQLKEFGLLR